MEIILIVILIILFISIISVYKCNKTLGTIKEKLEDIREEQKDILNNAYNLVNLYSQIEINSGIIKDKSVEACNKIEEIKDNNFDKKDLCTKFESLHARLDHNDDVNDAIIHKIIRLSKDKNKVKQEKK